MKRKHRKGGKKYLHAMSKNMAFPLKAVGEAAATELTGKTLLYNARSRATAAAAGRRCKDPWETEFKWLFMFRVVTSQVSYLL